ncbi:odontogenesis associated phosphoprotein [Meriones unguiculatus]|uniref:odontogenesis associated phosphoprotein n=1 Tax=Meriones unguiculatus TaxID=10047 RepID=UPI000B4E9D34|nr:odontogenesis associated phosphoprotein [Meriones unguiculatus]
MAPGLHFSFWLLVCWLVVTMAQGRDVVTPPVGSQNNGSPTDCQIFTLTPPPTTRNPVTRAQPSTRTPVVTWFYFPQRRPGFYPRFPKGPFLLPNYNRRGQFPPFYLPRNRWILGRLFLGSQLQSGSSSEESREE